MDKIKISNKEWTRVSDQLTIGDTYSFHLETISSGGFDLCESTDVTDMSCHCHARSGESITRTYVSIPIWCKSRSLSETYLHIHKE